VGQTAFCHTPVCVARADGFFNEARQLIDQWRIYPGVEWQRLLARVMLKTVFNCANIVALVTFDEF